MKPLVLVIRWVCILGVSFTTAFLLMHFGRRTTVFKEHLYQQLLRGNADEKLHAASVLAAVGGEKQLLRALQEEEPAVHGIARRGLEHMWFYAAGQEAYDLMASAYDAAEAKDFPGALRILDRLAGKYPNYAEGWNRRAAVLWQMEDYEKSLQACCRALQLNPNHYGAWQGLGICRLQLGELAEACRCLRSALKIAPHDEPTLRSLQQCEQLLHTVPAARREEKPSALL